ncbi:MAG: T9SS type A sorting domain-containing protein, partial [Cyclonatronaceae bacterium]
VAVEDGGELTVNSARSVAGQVTVAENATLAGDNLTVESGAFLLNDGSVTGNITFERLITAPTFNANGEGHWITLTSPVENGDLGGSGGTTGLLSNIWTQGFPGASDSRTDVPSNVLFYDESVSGTADNGFIRPSGDPAGMAPGRGFFTFLYQYSDGSPPQASTEVDFSNPFDISGGVNDFDETNNDFDFTITCSNGCGTDDGWNLLGNPFGASLNWADADWTKTNIDDFAYLWDPSGNYKVTSGGDTEAGNVDGVTTSDNIAPFQAFFVKANASEPTLSVSPGARTTNADNAGLFNENPAPVLALKLSAGESESFTGFRFGENYTEDFSSSDAYFLSPMATTFAYTYSLKDNRATLLNSLPVELDEPMEFSIAAGAFVENAFYEGEASFSWPTFENMPTDWTITLTDSHTGSVIDLREADKYEFNMSPGLQEVTRIESFRDLQKDGSPAMNPEFAGERFTLTIDPGTTTSAPVDGELPAEIALKQNYPNPFNPATQIAYDLPESSEVSLEVFNVQGQRVATLVDGRQNAGSHTLSFDAADLASGVYLYRLRVSGEAGSQVITRKMTLIK